MPIRLHPLTRLAGRVTYRLCALAYIPDRVSQIASSLFQVSSARIRSRLGRASRLFMRRARDGMTVRRQNIAECLFSRGVPRPEGLTDTNARRRASRRVAYRWRKPATRSRVCVHLLSADIFARRSSKLPGTSSLG